MGLCRNSWPGKPSKNNLYGRLSAGNFVPIGHRDKFCDWHWKRDYLWFSWAKCRNSCNNVAPVLSKGSLQHFGDHCQDEETCSSCPNQNTFPETCTPCGSWWTWTIMLRTCMSFCSSVIRFDGLSLPVPLAMCVCVCVWIFECGKFIADMPTYCTMIWKLPSPLWRSTPTIHRCSMRSLSMSSYTENQSRRFPRVIHLEFSFAPAIIYPAEINWEWIPQISKRVLLGFFGTYRD